MRGDGCVRHTKKALGHNGSHFETIEVLGLYLPRDSLQGLLDLARSNRPEERRFDFISHEKELPSCSLNLAIESEAIKRLNDTPISKVRFTLERQDLGH